MKVLSAEEKKENTLNFEELGIDRLFVDEAHYCTVSEIQALQQQKTSTLSQIQSAPDQNTVQKLTAQASALDGQIAALGQQQQTSTDQVVTQNIADQNDKAMKAQSANEMGQITSRPGTGNRIQDQYHESPQTDGGLHH